MFRHIPAAFQTHAPITDGRQMWMSPVVLVDPNVDTLALMRQFKDALRTHAYQLAVSESVPYKEVDLGNGYVLFAELTCNGSQTARLQGEKNFTTTHGLKNPVWGFVAVQLRTTTYWTYDYTKVVSGYTTATGEPKMLGWSLRNKSVDGPLQINNGREWQWTASAVFAYNVAGIEFDTIELITEHRVDYKGAYWYRYSRVD